jgi:hypothetical protein
VKPGLPATALEVDHAVSSSGFGRHLRRLLADEVTDAGSPNTASKSFAIGADEGEGNQERAMTIKFRELNFKDGNPYAGGPCILEDGSVAWAAVSDEDDGKGGRIARLVLVPPRGR